MNIEKVEINNNGLSIFSTTVQVVYIGDIMELDFNGSKKYFSVKEIWSINQTEKSIVGLKASEIGDRSEFLSRTKINILELLGLELNFILNKELIKNIREWNSLC